MLEDIVSKLVAFCTTCQCFLFNFFLIPGGEKQQLNDIKNYLVGGGPRGWASGNEKALCPECPWCAAQRWAIGECARVLLFGHCLSLMESS